MGVTSVYEGRSPSWLKCAAMGIPARRRPSRPLRPIVIASISTGASPFEESRDWVKRSAVRMAFAFSEPARPRSVVIMISATRRTGRRARSGSTSSPTTAATRLSTSRSSSE